MAPEHPILTLAIRLQFEFAARMSEVVLMLEWEWIDFANKRVVWPDSKTGGMSKPLSAEALQLLKEAPRYEHSRFVIPALFDGSQAMTKNTYWAGWKRILDRAGLPHCGTHAVRHRAATDIANSGVPVKVGMALRGVGIQHLGAARFSALPFPLPPAAEQERIVTEAEVRLSASRDQRLAVEASIARFDTMRRENWAAAVSGRLAMQDSRDEPAETLIARLGPPAKPTRRVIEATEKENIVSKPPRRAARTPLTIRPLAEVLAEAD